MSAQSEPWSGFQQYPTFLRIRDRWRFDLARYAERLDAADDILFTKNLDYDIRLRIISAEAGCVCDDDEFRTSRGAERTIRVSCLCRILRACEPRFLNALYHPMEAVFITRTNESM